MQHAYRQASPMPFGVESARDPKNMTVVEEVVWVTNAFRRGVR